MALQAADVSRIAPDRCDEHGPCSTLDNCAGVAFPGPDARRAHISSVIRYCPFCDVDLTPLPWWKGRDQ